MKFIQPSKGSTCLSKSFDSLKDIRLDTKDIAWTVKRKFKNCITRCSYEALVSKASPFKNVQLFVSRRLV